MSPSPRRSPGRPDRVPRSRAGGDALWPGGGETLRLGQRRARVLQEEAGPVVKSVTIVDLIDLPGGGIAVAYLVS